MIKNMIEKIEAEIKELNKRIERKTGNCFFDESRRIDRLNERIENKQCMKELLLKPEFEELERLAEIGRATENKEKPIETMSVDEEMFCTNCHSCLVGRWNDEDDAYNIFYNYCPECGQAISKHIRESEAE